MRETHYILLVGGPLDEAKYDIHVDGPSTDLPVIWPFTPDLVYRRTNVYVPGRHDADNKRRQVFLYDELGTLNDEEILDFLQDADPERGGEAGGA